MKEVGVRGFEQMTDVSAPRGGRTLGPAGRDGIYQVERRRLIDPNLVRVADDPLDPYAILRRNDWKWTPDNQMHVVQVHRPTVSCAAGIQNDIVAEPSQGARQAAREMNVSPRFACGTGGRRRLD